MTFTVSPIAIDLGGKNTGLYLGHYVNGEMPSKDHSRLATLVMPEEGGKMSWSQQGRTQTRHRIRSNKRAKLSKRLLKVVIQDGFGYSLSAKEWECLSGLLNRRGYTRTEVEIDLSHLSNTDPAYFAELFPDHFCADVGLLEQWEALQNDVPQLRSLNEAENFGLAKNIAKKTLFASLDKDEKSQAFDALFCMQDAVNEVLNHADYGHQHRRDYLDAIRAEIAKDSRLDKLKTTIGEERLFNVVGNISNFQLRTLRWYFNDVSMKEGDRFDAARLRNVIIRWLQGWHNDSDTKPHCIRVLALLEGCTDVLAAIASVDPKSTIPPYEDQNNRRPPKDQTLWLNPKSLNARYGETWTLWANNLLVANPGWDEGIQEQLRLYERKSRLPTPTASPLPVDTYAKAIFLQRILDRSRSLDPYLLRLLVKGGSSQTAQTARERLTSDLGSQHVDSFIAFCKAYYSELELAKQGLWVGKGDCLFECAQLNPPSKKRILHMLVGNILREPLEPDTFTHFLANCWNHKVSGNSSLRSICKKAEDVRKEQGNLFKSQLERILYRVRKEPAELKKLNATEKEIYRVHENCAKAADFIGDFFKHDEETRSKYNNPYSLAQLYTLIETDRHGFSKITLAAHLETNWRMGIVKDASGESSARCSRLVADTVRPFDGVLRRVLDRQAYEIAKLKVEQITSGAISTNELVIPIIAEENRFSFSAGLAELKKSTSKKKMLEDKLKQQSERWLKKDERIKSASELCPYTGKLIGHHGEIDHIVPRAFSLDAHGTVFNSEANLIWCSRAGNQAKQDQRYYLANLAPEYLKSVFGTGDLHAITRQIEATVNALPEQFIFQDLSDEQQRDVRHALFLEPEQPASKAIFRKLASQQASRVNGTQAWLVRSVMVKITDLLAAWCNKNSVKLSFKAARVSPELTSGVRRALASNDSRYEKTHPQPVASHAVDALCALAVAADQTLAAELGLPEGISEAPSLIESMCPSSIDVIHISRVPLYEKERVESQPLFKEGIYSENMLPIWISEHFVRVGFDPNTNYVEANIDNADVFFEDLRVLCDGKLDLNAMRQSKKPMRYDIDRDTAFDLLAKVAKQPCSPDELRRADLIDAFTYVTKKASCESRIFNAQTKKFASVDEVLKADKFSIKINKSFKKIASFKGELRLPSYHDWNRLLKHPSITPLLGSKVDEFDWQGVLSEHFKSGSNRPHAKTRRDYSLPIIDNPSGGFRIKRKAPNGNFVWQLVAISSTASSGFGVKDGNVEWSDDQLITALNSRNVFQRNSRYKAPASETVYFNKWLTIAENSFDCTRIDMAPGTKDRCYLRVTQPFTVFQQWLKACDVDVDHPLSLSSSIKVDGSSFLNAHKTELLHKPRSTLTIERVGDTMSYWYIVDGFPKPLKDLYQLAYSSSLKPDETLSESDVSQELCAI